RSAGASEIGTCDRRSRTPLPTSVGGADLARQRSAARRASGTAATTQATTSTAAPHASAPYDENPMIAPARMPPTAPPAFIERSDRPWTDVRDGAGVASTSSADPATSPHDQPSPRSTRP